jgi:hypothetical protein
MVAAYYLLLSTGTPSFLPLHEAVDTSRFTYERHQAAAVAGHIMERVAAAAAAVVNAIALQ